MKKLNILELFGGIGAIRKALINLRVEFEVLDYVEVDKNAVRAYNLLYDEDYIENSVVRYQIETEKQIDILIHGSPCQDFSIIGKKQGGEKGSGTRSSLLFETIRIIEEMKEKPKWIIWENVKGVLNEKFKDTFSFYIEELKRLGYESKFKILNAKDFGLPQNRERVFVISFLGENKFDFEKLDKRRLEPIENFLEKEVSNEYVVKQKSILKILEKKIFNKSMNKKRAKVIKDYCYTISTKQVRLPNAGFVKLKDERYRYLTEKECFRLMGFSDEDFKKLENEFKTEGKLSSTLYKLAGNSIVVDVLIGILKEIIEKEQ
ncbi:MAG: DNA (cytosine-5-)-methyltransferase [Parvimonas sp.]|uniref:DNA cytosine methyltransferase n=1 Tax=Parvimonas sp. TaxID=1944660 RepID=UPI0025F97DF7|nr:DNA (cytosine-5-)-methyltransferase [Parvimonas sp.]MCI5997053.1 DNA (cytosine-5-)-methyltransferase [Parvimonas sp.]